MFDDLMVVAKIIDLVVFLGSLFGTVITAFSLFSESSNPPAFVGSLIVCIVSGLVLYLLSNN